MGSDPLSSALTSTKPTPIPTHDEDHDPPLVSSSTSLLSFNTDSSSPQPSSSSSHKPLLISLIIITCISLLTAFVFAFLFLSSSPKTETTTTTTPSISLARPLTKLKKPVVLLVSSDGFRFGYQFKTFTPNIGRLIQNGTEAEKCLIPVFPSLTFPNHYSITTGLYPSYHGIVNNHFLDPISGEAFYMGSHDNGQKHKITQNKTQK